MGLHYNKFEVARNEKRIKLFVENLYPGCFHKQFKNLKSAYWWTDTLHIYNHWQWHWINRKMGRQKMPCKSLIPACVSLVQCNNSTQLLLPSSQLFCRQTNKNASNSSILFHFLVSFKFGQDPIDSCWLLQFKDLEKSNFEPCFSEFYTILF